MVNSPKADVTEEQKYSQNQNKFGKLFIWKKKKKNTRGELENFKTLNYDTFKMNHLILRLLVQNMLHCALIQGVCPMQKSQEFRPRDILASWNGFLCIDFLFSVWMDCLKSWMQKETEIKRKQVYRGIELSKTVNKGFVSVQRKCMLLNRTYFFLFCSSNNNKKSKKFCLGLIQSEANTGGGLL